MKKTSKQLSLNPNYSNEDFNNMRKAAEERIKSTLLSAPNDAARVRMFMAMNIEADDVAVAKSNHNQKSADNSIKLREYGNAYLKENSKENALSMYAYTQSIAFAPPNSEALALAFANRAAVLKDMGHFADSIADTQRAFKNGYPENLCYKLYFRIGICYQNLGQGGQALAFFNEAATALENSTALRETEKEAFKQNIESKLKYLHNEEEAVEFEDLTRDKSIGVLKFEVPSLGSNVNPEIPSASDCIALKYNKTFGRHLVATRDIEPGEVLIVEEPFAAVLETSLSFSHCSHCFKLCRTLLPCRDCTWAMFCSEACIEESYNYHQLECAVMPSVLEANINQYSKLAIRVVACAGIKSLLREFFAEQRDKKPLETNEEKRTAGFNKDGKYESSDLNTIANLCYHEPSSFELMICHIVQAADIMEMFHFNRLPFGYDLGGFIYKFLCSVKYNCNAITEFNLINNESEYGLLGICIYPTYSLLNHSCNANTFYHFYGKTKVVRALKLIKKNSQIFTFSGKSFTKYSIDYRHEHFKTNLKFECQCDACIGNWPTYKDLPQNPSFSLPKEKSAKSAVESSVTRLEALGVGDWEEGFGVTTKTLQIFRSHLMLLDKLAKTKNKQYYMVAECLRNYYNMLGNHVPGS